MHHEKTKDFRTPYEHRFFITATISIVSVILILLFIVINSIPALKEIGIVQFITGKTWAPANIPASFGLLPMILGSLYVTAGAVLIGVPLGLFTAVFMARFCPEKLYKVLKPLIDLLAGIPSIVYGFLAWFLSFPLFAIPLAEPVTVFSLLPSC